MSAPEPRPEAPRSGQEAPASRLFCFGLGYTAQALARELKDEGWSLAGTCRAGEDVNTPCGSVDVGDICLFERKRPVDAHVLEGVTHLLSSVPPDGAGDPVLDEHGDDIKALKSLRWVGYLSTTGVYGNRDGGWVDEESSPRPTGGRGRRRLGAEQSWLGLARDFGVPVHVFRLAGIYGPGRSALDAVREGTAKRIVKPGQIFSRVHVADIVQVLRASMARPSPGRIYNVCDDCPAPAHDVVAFACELLGVEAPPLVPFEEADLSPMARSFYADNKRVANDRIKRELKVKLEYPDYRTGLEACL